MLLFESMLLVSKFTKKIETIANNFFIVFIAISIVSFVYLIGLILLAKYKSYKEQKRLKLSFSPSDVQMTKSNSVLQVQTKDIKLIKSRCENGNIVYKCAVNIEELKSQNSVENVIGNTIFLTEQEYILCKMLIQEYDEIEIIQRKYRCRIKNGELLDLISVKNFLRLDLVDDNVELCSFDIPQITNSHDQLTEEIKKILFETMETEIWKLIY